MPLIDLSSDTATRPTPEMRAVMAHASVGDEQFGRDPTVAELQTFAAELLGKEAALFLPSATMANQVAIKTHTVPGDEIICHTDAHIRIDEGGGPALLSGCLISPLTGERGVFSAEQVRESTYPDDPHHPRTRLVCLENTHNVAGGCALDPTETAPALEAAREMGLLCHLDGARLMNASVALGIPAATLAAPFDTVTICLSKGLGAPVGAILAGSAETMHAAYRWKKVFGGAMRQAGIIAAGGLYGLQHNVARLRDDHAHAAYLAEGLAAIPGLRPDPFPQTNIVYVDIRGTGHTSADLKPRLLAAGVRASGMAAHRLRFVTHLDIGRADIDAALAIVREVIAGL